MKPTLRGGRAALAGALALVVAASGAVTTQAAARSDAAAQPTAVSTLVGIRAGHHPGYDRVVLDLTGPLPADRMRSWVSTVTEDGSGRIVHVAGHAFLQIVLHVAQAHDAGGQTVRTRKTYALPNVTQTLLNGDFEGYVSVAIGLQRKTQVLRFFTLTAPSRVVIDISTPYTWYQRRAYYLNAQRYASGTRPYTIAVPRPVIPPTVARQALERLFAGPTVAELGRHLRFVRSGATGFSDLSVSGGIARVRLTGGCDSRGSTYTIANEIFPTLKQFATVDHVKIYGPKGYTEQPTGDVDSIPPCLEP
ncbi:MAG: GerMN domain-containing protein [Frankiaceae bacterium]